MQTNNMKMTVWLLLPVFATGDELFGMMNGEINPILPLVRLEDASHNPERCERNDKDAAYVLQRNECKRYC